MSESKQGEGLVAKRIVGIDVARSIAIAAVIVIHAMESSTSSPEGSSAEIWRRVTAASVTGLGRIGVPLFLMITGFLMLGRDYSGSRLRRFFVRSYFPLLVSFEIWNLLTFVTLRVHNALTVKQWALSSILIGKEIDTPFWYMRMILVLYPLVPFAAALIRRIPAAWHVPLVMTGIVIFSLVPTVVFIVFPDLGSLPAKILKVLTYCCYPSYIVLGYALRGRGRRIPSLALLCGAILGIAATGTLFYWSVARGIDTGMMYWALPVVFSSVCVFLLSLRTSDSRSNRFVNVFAQSAYGMYVTHHPIIVLGAACFASLFGKIVWCFIFAPALSLLLVLILRKSSWCRRWMLQMH